MTDKEIGQILARLDNIDKSRVKSEKKNDKAHEAIKAYQEESNKELKILLDPLVKNEEYRTRFEAAAIKTIKVLGLIAGLIATVFVIIGRWFEFFPNKFLGQ